MSGLKSLDPALIGAVADLLANESKARHASVRELVAELARSHEKIDAYGNVIENKFLALEPRMQETVKAYLDALQLKDGAPAEPWRHRRAYDPKVEDYRAGDVVAHDGGSSVALINEPGPLPGDGWAQLTQRGKNGKPGDRGEKGAAGKDGVGIDEIFLERGALVVLLTDGRVKELPLSVEAAA